MSIETARRVLRIEAAAIEGLIERLDARFDAAVELMLNCKGRVVVMGMGKSGLIGRKIAATLSSTGTPSLFLHPAEECRSRCRKAPARAGRRASKLDLPSRRLPRALW